MKDQYVGDQNDFLKYALLRALAGRSRSICVVWMLTSSDTRSDGQRLRYLTQRDRFRNIDPELYDALGTIVADGERTIGAVENSSILTGSAFVSDVLGDEASGRTRYFERTWTESVGKDLIFFDPDNGLEVRSIRKGQRGSSKYLYWDELALAYGRHHSVVVYQHFPRRRRGVFLKELAAQMRARTGCRNVFMLTTAHVAFLILPQLQHEGLLSIRLNAFAARAIPHASARLLDK